MRASERDGIIRTVNREMESVLRLARKAGESKASILIVGESGTGKELLAREIHRVSDRSRQRFLGMNCAAVPEGLLESELFGHEKGSFTGAVQSRPGKFEQAHLGTLLLDEVSELPIALQAKLLRVLQEGELDRIGSTRSQSVDVRIVATSNKDLRKMIQSGHFREDLYYRLNVIQIHVPPLRKRPDDVEFLANFFAEQSSRLNGKGPKRFTAEAIQALQSYGWPGNVRELENLIERAVVLSDRSLLDEKDLNLPKQTEERPAAPNLIGCADQKAADGSDAPGSLGFHVGMTLEQLEALAIRETLRMTKGNRTQTARILGLSVRALRYKLNGEEGDRVNE